MPDTSPSLEPGWQLWPGPNTHYPLSRGGAGRGGAGGHRWRAELPSPGMSPPVMDQEAAGGWGWTLRMWQLGHNSKWYLVHVSVAIVIVLVKNVKEQ